MTLDSHNARLKSLVKELEKILRDDPTALDETELSHGEDVLAFFEDPNFKTNVRGLTVKSRELLYQVIDDLAAGAPLLSVGVLGISFTNNEIRPLFYQFGDSPSVNIVFSIRLKDSSALRAWKENRRFEISQDDINAAIYALVVRLSRLPFEASGVDSNASVAE